MSTSGEEHSRQSIRHLLCLPEILLASSVSCPSFAWTLMDIISFLLPQGFLLILLQTLGHLNSHWHKLEYRGINVHVPKV